MYLIKITLKIFHITISFKIIALKIWFISHIWKLSLIDTKPKQQMALEPNITIRTEILAISSFMLEKKMKVKGIFLSRLHHLMFSLCPIHSIPNFETRATLPQVLWPLHSMVEMNLRSQTSLWNLWIESAGSCLAPSSQSYLELQAEWLHTFPSQSLPVLSQFFPETFRLPMMCHVRVWNTKDCILPPVPEFLYSLSTRPCAQLLSIIVFISLSVQLPVYPHNMYCVQFTDYWVLPWHHFWLPRQVMLFVTLLQWQWKGSSLVV